MQWVFQFGRAYLWKNREIYSWIKICSSKKVEKTFKILINNLFFVFFFQLTFSVKKQTIFFDRWWICDFMSLEVIHQKKSITVVRLIVQNILTKIKLYSGIKATWQLSYTWFIFWAFRQTGKTGKKYLKQPGIHRKYF